MCGPNYRLITKINLTGNGIKAVCFSGKGYWDARTHNRSTNKIACSSGGVDQGEA